MALFRRKDSEPARPHERILPDPQAFAPIPPPAPYRPALYFPADLPQDHIAVQEDWAREPGNESDKNPIRRRRYAKDTEYGRELSTVAVDGIGRTDPGFGHATNQGFVDPRVFGVNPDIGKRPISVVGNPEKYVAFRPYQQDVARNWPGIDRKQTPILPVHVRQGNYANRQWRLTARYDPLSSETFDYTPAANDSRVTAYNAASSVRRNFRK